MGKFVLFVVVVAVLALSAVPAFAQAPPIMTGTADSLLESVLQFIADSGLGIIVAAGAIIGLFGLVMRRLKGAVR